MTKLWERQSQDTEDSWLAFCRYRDQRPPRRLILTGHTVGSRQVHEWFREHNWKERVIAYDNHWDSLRTSEREALLKQEASEVVAEHMSLLSASRELVARELEKYVLASRDSEMQGLIKPSELAKMLDLTIKYDRLIRDQTTERVDVGPDLSSLTVEELRALEELHRKIGENT